MHSGPKYHSYKRFLEHFAKEYSIYEKQQLEKSNNYNKYNSENLSINSTF